MADVRLPPGGAGQAYVQGSPSVAYQISPVSAAVGATLADMILPSAQAAGATTADWINVSPRAVADNGNVGDTDAKLRLPANRGARETGLVIVATRDGSETSMLIPWGYDTGDAGESLPLVAGESLTVIVRYPLDGTRPYAVIRVGAGPLGESVTVRVSMSPDIALTRAALNSLHADIAALRADFAALSSAGGVGAPVTTTQIDAFERDGNSLRIKWTRNGAQQSLDVALPVYHEFELVSSAAELAAASTDETLLITTAFGVYAVGDVLARDGAAWAKVLNLAQASVLTPNSVSRALLTQALRDAIDAKLDASGVDARVAGSLTGDIAQSLRRTTQLGTGTVSQRVGGALTRLGDVVFPEFLPADQITMSVEFGPNDDNVAHVFAASGIKSASQTDQSSAANAAQFSNAHDGNVYSLSVEGGDRRALVSSANIEDITVTLLLTRTFARAEFLPDASADAKGAMSAADKSKLDAIEDGATADQSPAEIRDALEGFAGVHRLSASAIKDLPDAGLDAAGVDARIRTPARAGNAARWPESKLPKKADDILDAFSGDDGWIDAAAGASENIYVSEVFSSSANVDNPNLPPYVYANQAEATPRQVNVYGWIRKPETMELGDSRWVATDSEGDVLEDVPAELWSESQTTGGFVYYVTPLIANLPVGATYRVQTFEGFTPDRKRLGLGAKVPAPADPGDDGKVPVAQGGVVAWERFPAILHRGARGRTRSGSRRG